VDIRDRFVLRRAGRLPKVRAARDPCIPRGRWPAAIFSPAAPRHADFRRDRPIAAAIRAAPRLARPAPLAKSHRLSFHRLNL
jgi:hypothetical protein